MPTSDKLRRKLRRYRARLAHWRRLIKDTEKEFKKGRISKDKAEKLKRKYETKKSNVIAKIRKTKMKQ
jgi:hypothetical protein